MTKPSKNFIEINKLKAMEISKPRKDLNQSSSQLFLNSSSQLDKNHFERSGVSPNLFSSKSKAAILNNSEAMDATA